MKNNIHGIISAIAITLSIIAIVISLTVHYPRTNLDFDYLGLLVGILALLVTVLIGWDIYKAISIEKTIQEKTEAAESSATCVALAQLGLALYRMQYDYQAITALTNALLAWQPQKSMEANNGATCAQDLLCKIFTKIGKFDINDISEELCILRSIKSKLTNTELLNLLNKIGI